MRQTLKAAAMTYEAGALASVAQLPPGDLRRGCDQMAAQGAGTKAGVISAATWARRSTATTVTALRGTRLPRV